MVHIVVIVVEFLIWLHGLNAYLAYENWMIFLYLVMVGFFFYVSLMFSQRIFPMTWKLKLQLNIGKVLIVFKKKKKLKLILFNASSPTRCKYWRG